MKKLSKEQLHRKEKLAKELAKDYAELQNALSTYNITLEEVNAFREEVVEEIDAFMLEQTEAWQDSEKNQLYQDWLDKWEELDLEGIDEPDEILLEEIPDSP